MLVAVVAHQHEAATLAEIHGMYYTSLLLLPLALLDCANTLLTLGGFYSSVVWHSVARYLSSLML
jgi:hypothetical protein